MDEKLVELDGRLCALELLCTQAMALVMASHHLSPGQIADGLRLEMHQRLHRMPPAVAQRAWVQFDTLLSAAQATAERRDPPPPPRGAGN